MIAPKELRQLALLARLELNEDALPALAQQMEQMVAFASAVCGAETAAAAEEAHFSSLRVDEVLPSLPLAAVLQNAPRAENGCFTVGKRGDAQ